MNINDKLFAVSSKNFVIPLVVKEFVNIMPEDNYGQIITAINLPESEQHSSMKTHHRSHFLNLFTCDGTIEQSSIFFSNADAIEYARSRNDAEIESLEMKMKELIERREMLRK